MNTNVGKIRGVTMVDVLIGLAVALLAVAVVYQSLVVVQAMRRNSAAVSDAQATGALALAVVTAQLTNAGAGITAAARAFETCPFTPDVATSLRPLSVLITDGGAADRADSLVVRQSLARTPGLTLPFVDAATAGSNFRIATVDGIAVDDRVAVVSRAGPCVTTKVTNVTTVAPGVLDIAHDAVTVDLPITSVLVNFGPAARGSITRFDLVSTSLRSTDVSNGDAPTPLVSNVVNLKFQYGIDIDGNGTVDTWVAATAGSPWDAATLLAAPRSTTERVRAIRVGLIARSEQPERGRTGTFRWVLFDCEFDDKSTCPGRLTGAIAATANGAYRYHVMETIVPLRNVIWNAGA
jgi:type IV pilus assembly protein PilW